MDLNSKYIDIGEEKLRTAFDPENYEQIIKSLKNSSRSYALYRSIFKYEKQKSIPFFFNIPITGEFIFYCDRSIWQMLIFEKFIYNRSTDKIDCRNIVRWIQHHQNNFKINWEYSKRTYINGKYRMLISDVLNKYMQYLDSLGFISFSVHPCYPQEGQATIIKTRSLIPPNQSYEKKLRNAVTNVNEFLPNVDEQIEKSIRDMNK